MDIIPNIENVRYEECCAKVAKEKAAQEFYNELKIKILSASAKQINKDAKRGKSFTSVGFWDTTEEGIEIKDQYVIPKNNGGLDVLPVWKECKLELEAKGYKVELDYGHKGVFKVCYFDIFW